MLEPLLGSVNAERCLMFILSREEGYASAIAKFFDTDLNGVQKKKKKLENGGILASYKADNTRLYRFNPRYAFSKDLLALLEKALLFYAPEEQERLRVIRRLPRSPLSPPSSTGSVKRETRANRP